MQKDNTQVMRMKVLFVDNGVRGHHGYYFRALCTLQNVDPLLCIPERIESHGEKQYIYKMMRIMDVVTLNI